MHRALKPRYDRARPPGSVLLDELGFGPTFLEPLLRDYLRPLCEAFPSLAGEGCSTLDHHKSFVVRYRIGVPCACRNGDQSACFRLHATCCF